MPGEDVFKKKTKNIGTKPSNKQPIKETLFDDLKLLTFYNFKNIYK